MDYTAVVIRWCYEPAHHINAQPPPSLDITEWCVSRWEGQAGQPTKQHLTMVCVKNKASVTEAVGNAVVRKAANLWMPHNMNEMRLGSFMSTVSMREDTSLTIENMYAKVTSPCRGRSFYEYVTGMADLARALGWSETKNSLCGDPDIMHKLHSQHTPHAVSVIHETRSGRQTVRLITCTEPQSIYDLLYKHNIRCDKVWDDNMSISATAPCLALSRHNMPLVYAADTNGVHARPGPAEVLYHNMKYVSVHTRRHVMRHKPYLVLQSDDDALPPVCEIFGNRPAEPRCATDDLSTTVLYYSDPLCSVKDVVEADGRFHDRCTITQLTGPDDGGTCDRAIRDFDHDVLCIEGTSAIH